MPNIQQIVVPINGTAESFKALSLASDLAKYTKHRFVYY